MSSKGNSNQVLRLRHKCLYFRVLYKYPEVKEEEAQERAKSTKCARKICQRKYKTLWLVQLNICGVINKILIFGIILVMTEFLCNISLMMINGA